jgi:hypothetical protein
MKTKLSASALVFFLLLGILWLPVKSAVVTEISKTEYSNLLSISTFSWKAEMISGFPSESTLEVTLIANTTQSVHHLWSIPEQIEISYDTAGNLSVRVGSTLLVAQPIERYDAIGIQIRNLNFSDEFTEFRDWSIDGVSARNLFAENTQTGAGYDQVLITDFNTEFFLKGSYFKGVDSILRDSVITITGFQIPEPSTLFLLTLSCVLLFSSRRR